MKIVITGGMGCGKSTVLEAMRDLLPDYFFDSYDREILWLYAQKWFQAELLKEFGTAVKWQVASIVFGDPEKMARLVAIADPHMREFLSKVAAKPDVVIEIPMFYEIGGLEPMFDKVFAVWCAEDDQWARIRARDGIPDSRIKEKLSVQMDSREKARRADFVIDTSDGAVDVREQLEVALRVAMLDHV
jgi:dephospho-CoA kinase